MKGRVPLALLVAGAALSLTACTERPACPQFSANADGSYTIAKPTSEDVDGCEYEFDDQNLTTERDVD